MRRLEEAQDLEAIDPETPMKREAELSEAYLDYARIKREAKASRLPEVGDIVHAWDAEKSCCRAAIIMETMAGGDAEIRVHIPHESFQDWAAEHDESRESTLNDSWHWPCGERQ